MSSELPPNSTGTGFDPSEKVARMIRPPELTRAEPLLWSPGTGVQVWEMFRAAITGDLESIWVLLNQNPALVRCHFAYRTPLYFAVRENQVEVVSALLDRGADPLSLAVNDTLVEIARDRGRAQMVELLESTIAKLQGASTRGELAAAAIRNRDPLALRKLLDESPELLHTGDQRGNQPIHWAVMTRQIELIEELLKRGADINTRRFDGARPIQLTNGDYCFRGWRDVPAEVTTTPAEVFAYLQSHGAYVDICTASHFGDLNRVRELLARNPKLANAVSEYITYYPCSGTPLRNAAGAGHLEIVRLLLDHGADPNLPEEGIAPKGHALYSAVYNNHLEVAKLLLDRDAYPSPPVESSADALSIAIGRKNQAMVDLLCSFGSSRSVDLLAHAGDTLTAAAVFAASPELADDPDALSSAAGGGHDGFVRLMLRYQPDLATRIGTAGKTRAITDLLFEAGMNPSHPNWLRITPLHEFARRNDVERARVFLEHGADLRARDEDISSTPLGWAAKFGNAEMVRLLLDHGAPVELPDDPPWATPLAWAKRRGYQQIVAMLGDAPAP